MDSSLPNNANIVIPPDEAIYLKHWMIGMIISALVYGGMLFLSLSYVPLLLKTSNDISRRMRNFLLVYVTFMVTISTVYIIAMSVALTRSIFWVGDFNQNVSDHTNGTIYLFQNQFVGALCTIFASWGADGFMLWRCAVLYQGISRGRRITMIAILAFMALLSFGSGLAFIISNFHRSDIYQISNFLFFEWIIGTTVILNLSTATLITLRILYSERYVRKTMGLQRNGSPYIRVVIICVESSALIVVFSVIYLILFIVQRSTSYVLMQVLVHIYAISPLLITYRVALGKAVTIEQKTSFVSALHFESHTLSLSNDDV